MRDIGPHAVAYAIGGEMHLLSNWRRDGFHDYGERKGKANFYSSAELGRLALAIRLARHGIAVGEAFKIVTERSPQLDAEINRIRNGGKSASDYFLTISFDPFLSAGYTSISGAALKNISSDDPPIEALQINVSRLLTRALDRADFYARKVGEGDNGDK